MNKILSIKDSIISIEGDKSHFINQKVIFNNDITGVVLKATEKETSVIVDDATKINIETNFKVMPKEWSVKFDDSYLGNIIDVEGKIIYQSNDNKSSQTKYSFKQVDQKAPMFYERKKLNVPLETGIFSIDTIIPIGRGQRELIIGDRKTGKTSIALSTIINQKNKNIKVIYVAIGQKQTTLSDIYNTLLKHDAMEYTTILVASPELKYSQYTAPYVGMAYAESIAENNEDVLIIFDDLTKHANIARELSLNLNKAGGREAYPSDLFYLHSKLLERSGKFIDKIGGGSITALPILETIEGDFNTLLATNVISITDGQIMTDTKMSRENIYPSINAALSVSRTGSSVQNKTLKSISKEVSKIFAQYIESKKYELISLEISENVKKQIEKGKKLAAAFRQPGFIGLNSKDMLIILLIIKWDINYMNNINDFISRIYKDDVGKKLIDKLSFEKNKSQKLFKVYCQMISGQDNKFNAKRILKKEVQYE